RRGPPWPPASPTARSERLKVSPANREIVVALGANRDHLSAQASTPAVSQYVDVDPLIAARPHDGGAGGVRRGVELQLGVDAEDGRGAALRPHRSRWQDEVGKVVVAVVGADQVGACLRRDGLAGERVLPRMSRGDPLLEVGVTAHSYGRHGGLQAARDVEPDACEEVLELDELALRVGIFEVHLAEAE